MIKIRNKFIGVIGNWNLDIVWDLVFGNWCFYSDSVSNPLVVFGEILKPDLAPGSQKGTILE